ncbi:MAG: XRE family transcriptional regulator [Rhizobiaceae bacterium]|nr:MAG: XRE family transcriptional regulator [Rhizobiaceae bacterium]
MTKGDWKNRLIAGIKEKGKSQREVSLAAGKAPGYVNSLLKEGKDPTIENLILVCRAADLSLAWVLFGFEMTRETEEIVREIEKSGSERRHGLLQFLRGNNDEFA